MAKIINGTLKGGTEFERDLSALCIRLLSLIAATQRVHCVQPLESEFELSPCGDICFLQLGASTSFLLCILQTRHRYIGRSLLPTVSPASQLCAPRSSPVAAPPSRFVSRSWQWAQRLHLTRITTQYARLTQQVQLYALTLLSYVRRSRGSSYKMIPPPIQMWLAR